MTMHGRHLGEFLGWPPTGKGFATEQIHIWRISDGRVIEHWSVRDDLGQALQLGLLAGTASGTSGPTEPARRKTDA
jgi:predicted ester cyclase